MSHARTRTLLKGVTHVTTQWIPNGRPTSSTPCSTTRKSTGTRCGTPPSSPRRSYRRPGFFTTSTGPGCSGLRPSAVLNGSTTNLFSDYGMDFLAKGTNPDGTASYHACQVKYRTTSGWITADELGSFQSVVMQTGCPGYLYTNGSLDRRVKNDMRNSIHKQLPSRVYTEYLPPGRGAGAVDMEDSE